MIHTDNDPNSCDGKVRAIIAVCRAWVMTTFNVDEFARKKFFDPDIRYATLKMRAGFGWPFSSTGAWSSTPDIVALRLRRAAS